MRKIKLPVIAFLAFGALYFASHGRSQSSDSRSQKLVAKPHPELAITYEALRTNAPPAGCSCYVLSGAGVSFAWPLGQRDGLWYAVGDFAMAHNGSISSQSYSLTLSTYSAGVRWAPPINLQRLEPFAQVLLGVGHAAGSLVSNQNYAPSNAGASVASYFGGGADLRIHPRLRLRLADVGYQLTTFANASNNHQNSLQITSGLVLQF